MVYLPFSATIVNKEPLFKKYIFYRLSNLSYLKNQNANLEPKDKKLLAIINPTLDLKLSLAEGYIVDSMFKTKKVLLEKEAKKEIVLNLKLG